MCVRVAVHLDDPLFKSQTLITPIVSPEYRTAKISEIALPSRHSTGLVCDEMDPRLFNGSCLLKFERSLNHHNWDLAQLIILFIKNAPESYNLVRTSRYQNLETREDEQSFHKVIMGVRRWRYQFISLVLSNHYDLALCLGLKTMTYDCIPELDWLMKVLYKCVGKRVGMLGYTLSQAPLIIISLSPDPACLSQKARLVTGPVWPLKVERDFPVFTKILFIFWIKRKSQWT